MYSVKKLVSSKQKESFLNLYNSSFKKRSFKASRLLSKSDILGFDHIYGIFSQGKLFAGFVVNDQPIRCFEGQSENDKAKMIESLGKDKNYCELVCICKDKSNKNPIAKLIMWYFIIKTTVSFKRDYILGCNRSSKVGKQYYYSVEPTFLKRSSEHQSLDIFYYTPKQFKQTFYKSGLDFILMKNKVTKLIASVNDLIFQSTKKDYR